MFSSRRAECQPEKNPECLVKRNWLGALHDYSWIGKRSRRREEAEAMTMPLCTAQCTVHSAQFTLEFAAQFTLEFTVEFTV